MNNIDTTTDPLFNPSPHYTNWRHYDSPTILRRQGRGFLERTLKPDQLNPLKQEQYPLSKLELETLATSYGGVYRHIPDQMLLIFDDTHRARRCEAQLIKLGLSTQRCGCHIQLPEPGQ
jgi:hypothetical protein